MSVGCMGKKPNYHIFKSSARPSHRPIWWPNQLRPACDSDFGLHFTWKLIYMVLRLHLGK